MSGTLLDAAGRPIAGATVCVSQRPPLANSVERTLAVSRTNPAGRIRLRLPKGPSRIVYLTCWRDADRVVTSAVHLRVRAPVQLKIKPHHELHSGARPRYVARLRGPYHAHREVHFQAKAPGGRWFELPGQHGSAITSRRGIARTRMPRLRVSTSYRLRFRAVVPKQHGYPYARGTSKVRKRLVKGPASRIGVEWQPAAALDRKPTRSDLLARRGAVGPRAFRHASENSSAQLENAPPRPNRKCS